MTTIAPNQLAPARQRLEDAFTAGTLVRPLVHEPDVVHLTRALGAMCGVSGLDGYAATQQLIDLIRPSDHIIFILLDGLGMNIVRQLPAGAFLVRNLRLEMHAACPSTTAAALTSIATGEWPAHHAVTGWFTYLPAFGITATVLPFTERYSQHPLSQRGIKAEQVFPVPAFNPRMTRDQLTLLPNPIVNTTYASYSRGYTPGAGYTCISNAVDQIIRHIAAAAAPTFTHLYVPDIDNLCHKRGIQNEGVLTLVDQIDSELSRLADAIGGRARVVVCADHGLIDIAPANHLPIFDGDPLLDLLQVPPTGDGRMPLFHVRSEKRGAFIDMFQRRFAHAMFLLSIEEVERLRLLGPRPLSPLARRRFGDFVGIPYRPSTLLYHPPTPQPATPREPYIAQHAGLSPDEMQIPLVVL